MHVNPEKNSINVDGIIFKYKINYAFSDGGPKCLTIYRDDNGPERLFHHSPVIVKLFNEVKNSEYFQSEVDVEALMFLPHKKFIAKHDSFIMSDLTII